MRNDTPLIMVVDDDYELRQYVQDVLKKNGYDTLGAADGREALPLVDQHKPDLIILDLVMPYMNGWITCRKIRSKSQCPIIVLSALEDEPRKVEAFEEGADDYLTKPFGKAELLARVKAVLRRAGHGSNTQDKMTVRTSDERVEIDLEGNRVTLDGTPVRLTRTELNLIKVLAQHVGQIVSHRTLLRRVWGPEYGKETEYLHVYVGRIRRKLEKDPSSPRYIITEPGIGYRLMSD
jgi:two-component system KDP operon response regulator KdpE